MPSAGPLRATFVAAAALFLVVVLAGCERAPKPERLGERTQWRAPLGLEFADLAPLRCWVPALRLPGMRKRPL